MTDIYTRDAVTEALQKIVAEKGEGYIYQDRVCRYADDTGAPACIVGHLIQALSPEDFATVVEWEGRTGASTDVIEMFDEWIGVEVDRAVRDALEGAQEEQDNGKPWGMAFDTYLSTLERIDRGALAVEARE